MEDKEEYTKSLSQYNYEKVINLCDKYAEVYSGFITINGKRKRFIDENTRIKKLSALMDAILQFTAACPLLPRYLREPTEFFKQWELQEIRNDEYIQEGIVHPKGMLLFSWMVREELIRQLTERIRKQGESLKRAITE